MDAVKQGALSGWQRVPADPPASALQAFQIGLALLPSPELAPASALFLQPGSAAPHPHELVLGPYSVHSASEALAAGVQHIAELGQQLQQQEGMR